MPDSEHQRNAGIDALVVAARTNRVAFGRLYEAYYDRIFSYCLRRLNQRSAAEDVCSETFLYVARKMSSFRGDTDDDFRRWVYRIATNEVNAFLRRSIRRNELWNNAIRENRLRGEAASNPSDRSDSVDWSAVHHAVSQLNEREQSIVALRLQEEMSHDEIGRILGIRPVTVRVTYSRAIQKVRDLLARDVVR